MNADLSYFHNSEPWQLGEDIPNADLFFSNIWLRGFVRDFISPGGRIYKKILCCYENYHLWFYFGERDGYEVGEHLADRIVNEPEFSASVNKNIILQADKLREFSETIPQAGLDELSVEKLWRIYETHQKIHTEFYTWCWIPVAADMFHNNLTRKVKAYIESKGGIKDQLSSAFVALTQPTEKSLIFIERDELISIAERIAQNDELVKIFRSGDAVKISEALPADILDDIEKHRAKYYYTKHLWVSGEYTLLDYINQLKEIFSISIHPSEIRRKQYAELERARIEQANWMNKLNVEPKWQSLLEEFGRFMVTKIYRRYAQLLAVHHMSAVLHEIARRVYLTEKQIRFALPREVRQILLENADIGNELLARTRRCVYYADKDNDIIYTGVQSDKIFFELDKLPDDNITELRGEVGFVGYAKGKVKIIIRASDMDKMETGDILVSIATDPDIVPAMRKAAAIVTEQGGVTAHAAIVSRELGIPCVIGTKIATKIFKDGDFVEVDANTGVVRKITT